MGGWLGWQGLREEVVEERLLCKITSACVRSHGCWTVKTRFCRKIKVQINTHIKKKISSHFITYFQLECIRFDACVLERDKKKQDRHCKQK